MPHSYSGNKRTKRPDFRPNGKRRLKEQQAAAAATPVEELISTRIPKSKRKERPVTGALKKVKQHPDVVRIRALQKLLRQMASLAEKQQAGATLNAAQMKKLERFPVVLAELEELTESDDEDEDEDSEEKGDAEHEVGGDESEKSD